MTTYLGTICTHELPIRAAPNRMTSKCSTQASWAHWYKYESGHNLASTRGATNGHFSSNIRLSESTAAGETVGINEEKYIERGGESSSETRFPITSTHDIVRFPMSGNKKIYGSSLGGFSTEGLCGSSVVLHHDTSCTLHLCTQVGTITRTLKIVCSCRCRWIHGQGKRLFEKDEPRRQNTVPYSSA